MQGLGAGEAEVSREEGAKGKASILSSLQLWHSSPHPPSEELLRKDWKAGTHVAPSSPKTRLTNLTQACMRGDGARLTRMKESKTTGAFWQPRFKVGFQPNVSLLASGAAASSAVPPGCAPLCPKGQHPHHNTPLLLRAGEKSNWKGRKQFLPAHRGSLLGVSAAESQRWVFTPPHAKKWPRPPLSGRLFLGTRGYFARCSRSPSHLLQSSCVTKLFALQVIQQGSQRSLEGCQQPLRNSLKCIPKDRGRIKKTQPHTSKLSPICFEAGA